MSLTSPATRVLIWKELRQLRRSRGAIASATLLPLFLMTVMPLIQLFSVRAAAASGQAAQINGPLPPALADVANDPVKLFVRIMLPLFIILGGLIVPSISATYTVVAEREKRTLDLLMALPVRVGDVLLAKLVATVVLAMVVLLPLFTIDAAALLAFGLASPGDVFVLLLLLLSALGCSVGVALLLALLARDFRTANNLNGALLGPLIVGIGAVLFLVPGGLRYVALIALLLLMAFAAVYAGLRWLTFERYLA